MYVPHSEWLNHEKRANVQAKLKAVGLVDSSYIWINRTQVAEDQTWSKWIRLLQRLVECSSLVKTTLTFNMRRCSSVGTASFEGPYQVQLY